MANRDIQVDTLIINELTKGEFLAAEKSETELYFVTDENIAITDVDGLPETLKSLDEQTRQFQGLITGSVSSEPIMLAQIKEMKTSTFDLPKFTVVGNSAVTNDGIASGFSAANYITIPTNIGADAKFVSIKMEIKALGVGSAHPVFLANSLSNNPVQISLNNILGMFTGAWTNGVTKYNTGDTIEIKVEYDKSKQAYTLYSKLKGTFNWVTEVSATSPTNVFGSTFYIGRNATTVSEFYDGFIDLKKLSITADGVEVFNGNKTGIDQIKNDNYTVVGSPTITEYGVASGFSNTSYLRTASITLGNKTIMHGCFTATGTPVQSRQLRFFDTTSGNSGSIYLAPNYIQTQIGSVWSSTIATSKYQQNIPIFYTFIIENESFSCQFMQDGVDLGTLTGSGITGFAKGNTMYVELGKTDAVGSYGNHTADLNAFKIYVDGNLVYQPTLRIPYTLSKTGSKIVDVQYRNRVQDVYEQFGQAKYYTVGETDFTLPMGELYGMASNTKGGGGLEVGDIGISLFVEESKGLRRHLNGSIISLNANTREFFKKLKQVSALYPSIICTEDEWQEITQSSVGGQCGKFVINEDENTIRLPKIIMPIQGLTDLTSLGEMTKAGLPNITGGTGYGGNEYGTMYGAFYSAGASTVWGPNSYGRESHTALFDASRSNSIYGNSPTVQQEQVQYPYFIQIATGQETEANIVNTIELNNPFSLFDSKYSDHALNNVSWLLSQGQWNSGTIYTGAYELLLKIFNGTETIEGITVKAVGDDTITDYDFVIDTVNRKFKLPVLNGSEDVTDWSKPTNKSAGVLYTAECNGWIEWYAETGQNGVDLLINNRVVSSVVATGANDYVRSASLTRIEKGSTYKVDNNGVLRTFTFYPSVGRGSLYYYVGETVQNANLINAGRITEQYATKDFATLAGFPSNKRIDLNLGASGTDYIAPASGWVVFKKISGEAGRYITLFNSDNGLTTQSIAHSSGQGLSIALPVLKGARFTVEYSATGATNAFYFIYAEGEQ